MGQNIGTCITALLSSIGTSRKCTPIPAMVHLYFNIIGNCSFSWFSSMESMPLYIFHSWKPRQMQPASQSFTRLQYFRNTDPVPVCRRTGQTCGTGPFRTDRKKSRRSCSDARYPFPRQPGFLLCSSVKLQPQNGRTDRNRPCYFC